MTRMVSLVAALSAATFGVDALAAPDEAGASTNAAPRMKTAMEKTGGFVETPLPPNAKFIVVDDQRAEKDGAAEKFARHVGAFLHLASRVGEPQGGDVAITLADEGESAVFLDRPAAFVTVGADENETQRRLMSALMRIIGIEGRVMPQVYETAQRQAKALGVGQVRRTTYRKAVQEGWAPAPTNEFQRAIWDAAHSATNAPAAKAEAAQ